LPIDFTERPNENGLQRQTRLLSENVISMVTHIQHRTTSSPRGAKFLGMALLLAAIMFRGSDAMADEPTAAELKPGSMQLFIEINEPEKLLRLIRDDFPLSAIAHLWPEASLVRVAEALDSKQREFLFALDPVGVWRAVHNQQRQSLVETAEFQAAMKALPDDRVATFFVRRGDRLANVRLLGQLARAAVGVAVAESNLPKPLRRLAIQSALQPLEEVRFMAVSVSDREPKPHVTVVLPPESPRLAGVLRVLAAIPQQGRTSLPLVPSNTMLSISSFVNRQAIALAAETLFSPDRIAGLSQSNPEIAALLQGLTFTVDASRQIEPRVQIVIARRPLVETEESASQLRVPAVAVIFVPVNPKQMKQIFSLAFMGAMNEVNKTAQRQNRPRYRLVGKRIGEVTVTSGVLRERKEGQRPATPLLAGISPSIAFLDRRFIFSTDHELAVELVKLAATQPDATIDTSLRLNIGPIEILHSVVDNYEAALAQSAPLRRVHQLAGPLMDSTVATTRQLLRQAPSPKLSIDQPPIVLPFTLEVATP